MTYLCAGPSLNAVVRLLLFAVICFCSCRDALSQIAREHALAAAYPGAEIRAERIFLMLSQRNRIAEAGGVELQTDLVARYVAVQSGKTVGRAYVDTHVVRTKRESLLICLDENGKVKRIEVTAFLEPSEYQGSRAWYDQYNGKALEPDLRLHRAIRPIAGATLTAKAASDAVRRVLATDQVLELDARRKP